MEFSTFVCIYLAGTISYLVILLFGQNPVFRGTPIRWLHWLCVDGFFDAVGFVVERCCPERGQDCFVSTVEFCFDSPNPILQISYLAFMAIGYYLFYNYLFVCLPNPWVSILHKYTGTVSVVLSLVAFVLACRSDPGTVTADNVDTYNFMYPCDALLWSEKYCKSCHFMRPARSKHCSICKRCVVRHDHHCGWISNCVGLANLRLFLLFLLCNLVMCAYGALLSFLIIGGEMQRSGMLKHHFMDWKTGEAKFIYERPMRLLEHALQVYPVPSALFIFMCCACSLMVAFLGYHVYLICKGRTQYESYRLIDYQNFMLDQWAEQNDEGPRSWGSWCLSFFKPGHKVLMPTDTFNRGPWGNLMEVLFWESFYAAADRKLESMGGVDIGSPPKPREAGGNTEGSQQEGGPSADARAGSVGGAKEEKGSGGDSEGARVPTGGTACRTALPDQEPPAVSLDKRKQSVGSKAVTRRSGAKKE